MFFLLIDDDSSHKDTGPGIDQGHGAEVTDDNVAIDSLISEWEKSEGAQPVQSASAPSKPIPQKESVFVRLANRIKVSSLFCYFRNYSHLFLHLTPLFSKIILSIADFGAQYVA